jgi:nicotinamide-nucleotide amidase
MQVELITIGDELLLGFTVDTNAAFLGRELSALGVSIHRRATVGDDPAEITSAVSVALSRSDGVITTGGLGPTSDDITKPAVAYALGRRLRRDESIVAELESLWRSRGRSGILPSANLSQALVPEGARMLRNQHGTAPGVWIERDDGRWVAMLPGVPREMRAMYTDALRPLLVQRTRDGSVIRSVTVRTTGVAESQIPELLGDIAAGVPGVSLGYLPSLEGVDLRLTVRGHPAAEADQLLRNAATALHARVGIYAYGDGETDLAAVVISVCRARKITLAVAESCTGGLLGARLTAIPGASDVFRGGVIAYDNAVKTEDLGVPAVVMAEHGAVSEATALAMAVGARSRFGAEMAIAVTGIAGPTGGTLEKPIGTVWLALADQTGATARHIRFSGDRSEIRRRAAQAALDMVRRKLAG